MKSVSVREGTLRRVTRRLLRLLDEAGAEVCIGFIGDTKMRRLNRTYRNQDRTTDVLAFAYREVRPGVFPLLGDVVISVPTARRQAKALSHSLDEEVLRLLIHGVLHLVGYDHERSRRQARCMQRKETELFEILTPLPSNLSFLRTQESRVCLLADEGKRKGPGHPLAVIPAKAGIQRRCLYGRRKKQRLWIPD